MSTDYTDAQGGGGTRVLHVIAVLAVAVALVASAVEIFHNTAAQTQEAQRWQVSTANAAATAPTSAENAVAYGQLDAAKLGPNSGWSSHLNQLQFVHPPEVAEGRLERKREALDQRAQRRAFDGAPPTIPHRIDQRSANSCLACHGQGLKIDGILAPVMSHPTYRNCTQCHAPEGNEMAPTSPLAEVPNGFRGSVPAGDGGARAWPGAPPVMPHGTFMRESCNSCHGPMGMPGLRTTHPERQSCTQCHAPSATLEQRGHIAAPPGPTLGTAP